MAGRNNRYNNVQIDGAVNNDVFGLAPSGTPGGRPKRSRSASTRSRSCSWSCRRTTCARAASRAAASTPSPRAARNQFSGTAYFFGRNQDWVGESPTGTKIGARSRISSSAAASAGRSCRTRRSSSATSIGAAATIRRVSRSAGTGQQFGRAAEIDRFLNILQNRYGYDPGRHGRVHPDDQQRQDSSSAPTSTSAQSHQLDRPPQLSRRAERHRPSDLTRSTSCRTTSTGSRTRRTRPSCS